MTWLRALSHPYFSLLFDASWEKDMKARIANWFTIKWPLKTGEPAPLVWRAANFVSPDDTAWVQVEETSTYGIDYGGPCFVNEPVTTIPIPALALTLEMRCGTARELLAHAQRKLVKGPRNKYNRSFFDLTSWPGSVWTMTLEQLKELEAAVAKAEPQATHTFNNFMLQVRRGEKS